MSEFYAGIDSGSWNTKAVVIDDQAVVVGHSVIRSGADLPAAARQALQVAAAMAGVSLQKIARHVWATGFGRHALQRTLPFIADTRTELDCHARGVHHYISGALTVIDIGGQDAKVIQLDESGRRVNHKMNRKCAAGTGSFLEEIALRLGVNIGDLGTLAANFTEELNLASFCTVFASTELLSAIREGRRPADLARAAYKSVVKRVLEMAEIQGRVVVSGGVAAHHPMVIELLSAALQTDVQIAPHAQEMGAFGAALAARDSAGAANTHPGGSHE